MRAPLRYGNEEFVELKLSTKADLMFCKQNEFGRDIKKKILDSAN